MKKAKEDNDKILKGINLFSSFVISENRDFKNYLVKKLDNDYSIKNSFDLYHTAFANFAGCKSLVTFDRGFKKFNNMFDLDIKIL